ncbi:glutamate--cysteine ligase [Alkaliphilus sp. MSJ-5]|uniref:Glutamate--cysteine ligase n=1 Tax=Alkaliphilus flagellatus TaxID=2841507 RepID=A0ABS6G3U1_9FIRM|nr:glutamate-cysteine ligase family protein [Alkaliphilus flagellatus]MBU5676036.1 glutamate--cysteine ligase [Alkaliphilus flagellatus]
MKYEKNLESIVSIIKQGEKSPNQFRIGVEFEHIVVKEDTLQSVTYYGEEGIEGILNKLLLKGYKGKYEGDYLVGLMGEDREITLEPGGQLEVSIKPCDTIDEIKSIYFNFLNDIVPILEERNLLLMAIGYHPKSSIDQIPFNPKKRYEYMSKYLGEKGKYAHNMMKGTAALQVSIDYINEEDFIRKFRVANFISPLLYLISDNSPIFEGQIYYKFGLRSLIWENTDKQRSDIVPNSLNKKFGYKDYGKYILSVPPILVMKDGEFIGTGDKTVEQIMEEYTFSEEEIDHIMTMVFPDVRAKNYIELRMGDSLPYPYNFSYITLIKGIFYNEIALEYLYKLSLRAEDDQIHIAKDLMHEKGFGGHIGSKAVYDFIRIIFDLAKKALSPEEKEMLMPLEKLLINKNNLSTISKEKVRNEGVNGLKWCNLNQWVRGEEDVHNKGII